VRATFGRLFRLCGSAASGTQRDPVTRRPVLYFIIPGRIEDANPESIAQNVRKNRFYDVQLRIMVRGRNE
jgi:hypothetical protein